MEEVKSKEIFLARTEPVRQMEQTLHELFAAAANLGGQSAVTVKAIRKAMEARCLKCGAELTGSELFLLAESPRAEQANMIRRLRQNRCAREGCEFNLYKITFHCHADVDWAKLFSLIEKHGIGAEIAETESMLEEEKPVRALPLLPPPRIVIRTTVFAVAILSLFIIRQVYRGGTIPFIRVPEKFHVDVSPSRNTARPAE